MRFHHFLALQLPLGLDLRKSQLLLEHLRGLRLILLDPIKKALNKLNWGKRFNVLHLLVRSILVLFFLDKIPFLFTRVYIKDRVLLSELDPFIIEPLLLLEDADDLIEEGLIHVKKGLLVEIVIELGGAKLVILFLFFLLIPIILKIVLLGLGLNERLIQFRFGLPICSGKKLFLKATQVI